MGIETLSISSPSADNSCFICVVRRRAKVMSTDHVGGVHAIDTNYASVLFQI